MSLSQSPLKSFSHALVTGATGGLGQAFVKTLILKSKVKVISICGRNLEILQSLADFAKEHQVVLHYESFDCTDFAKLSDLFEKANSRVLEYPIDLFIANAGVSVIKNTQGIETPQEVQRGFLVNTVATTSVIAKACELMLQNEKKQGNIIAITSLAGLLNLEGSPVYSASKAAVISYIEALRPALKDTNIHITTAIPGFIKTPMSDRFIGSKPFMITAEKAAEKILKASCQNKKNIAFPMILYIGIKLLKLLPNFSHKIFLRFFYFSVAPEQVKK